MGEKLHSYKGVKFEWHHGKYVILTNKDLLELGLVTKKTLQKGHKGFKTLERLTKTIDKKR